MLHLVGLRYIIQRCLRTSLIRIIPSPSPFLLPSQPKQHRLSLTFTTNIMAADQKRTKQRRTAETEEHDDEHALDPTLAEEPDASDEEMARPAKKPRKSSSTSTSTKTKINSSSIEEESTDNLRNNNPQGLIDYTNSDNVGHDAKHAPKRNDFNPSGHKLPESPTPLETLHQAMDKETETKEKSNVVFWMRMRDLRIEDSRALAKASEQVQQNGKGANLIALFVLSPGDYRAHDRSPRRIDFVLRALRLLRKEFEEKYNVPFVVVTEDQRTRVPDKVLDLCKQWNASHVFGNIEYEVDELWRDIKVVEQAPKQNIYAHFSEDTYVVPPGMCKTKDGRQYSVFSPWNRTWVDILSKKKELLEASPEPTANDKSARSDKTLKSLFGKDDIPDHIAGFECKDAEYMSKLWPAGTEAAKKVLENFISGKGNLQVLEGPATDYSQGKTSKPNDKESRIARYQQGRNLMSENGSSRISPYLSAGMISARACLRRVREVTSNKLVVGRDSGPAAYNMEIGFRDFYGHVLAAWPRVCMGRAYITKYEDVVWEYDDKVFDAWKQGRTGYPIVDASMRQGHKQGYMHNRGRMIVAMFLTKHLMQDWRKGETWFMQNFIDGDFPSNNGGWQWSASTGTDPQPYFRIFAPLSQSEKCDPTGDYIRHWVPELAHIKGNAIHAPHDRLSKEEFTKLNYPEPIIEHKFARERALHRFKNVGQA